MNAKKVLLLFGALMVAVITAVMAKNMFAGAGARQAQAAPVPQGPKILVARKALPVGTIIDQEALTYQPWPKELIETAYYVDGQGADAKSLVGTVVRYAITAGQPVTRGALVGPEDRGFLAAALGSGMRAVAIPVNATTGVAGFVFPGDHVDIVLSQDVKGGGEGDPLRVAETIVRNVRVLATDQRVTDKDDEGKTSVKPFTNVTIEVTPRIAEKIAVAQQTGGSLSLSLRSIADNGAELERAVAAGDIKVPGGMDANAEKQMMKVLANRPIDSNTTFSTGGDVSRFQRKNVPSAPKSANNFISAARGVGQGINGTIDGAGKAMPTVKVARGNSESVVLVGSR